MSNPQGINQYTKGGGSGKKKNTSTKLPKFSGSPKGKKKFISAKLARYAALHD